MESPASSPNNDSYDRGSSVSSKMMEEYEDLLRYAVVTPNFNGSIVAPKTRASHPIRTESSTRSPPTGTTNVVKTTKLDDIFSSDDESVQEEEGVYVPTDSSDSINNNSTMNIRAPRNVTGYEDEQRPREITPTASSLMVQNPSGLRVSFQCPSGDNEDTELTRLDSQLDVWCSELKGNILAEFVQSKLKLKEYYNKQMHCERQQYSKDIHDLNQDLQRKLDLLKTYESSILKKDELIKSLTKSLHKQKERAKLVRTFSVWKYCYIDKKRESFTEKLAIRHCNMKMKSKILASWFGLIQGRWKQRVEKACQLRAEEVCHDVSNEYEDKLAALHHSYEEALGEISVLKQAQSKYEENMKKAFMRGVCALNMEAMSMFSNDHIPVTTVPTCHYDETPHGATSTDSRSSKQPCLNVKFTKSDRKGTKQPLVTVERHLPSK